MSSATRGLVAFLRGVNVGGHKAFRPAALAAALSEWDVVNVGAAGTFVCGGAISPAKLRNEILARLPVSAELMTCRGSEFTALESAAPFSDVAADDVTAYVSILARRPKTPPALPLCRPDGEQWQVKLIALTGRFVLSLHRRRGRTLVYPNEVVERQLGVPSTTRNWNTILAVCKILSRR